MENIIYWEGTVKKYRMNALFALED